jgi:DNA polymerase-3 subunit delta
MNYLVHGNDVSLCSEKVKEIINNYSNKNQYSLISLDCEIIEKNNFNELSEHLLNISMFDENKIIKCNNVQNKHLKYLEKFITSPDRYSNHILILIGNEAIDNKSKIKLLCTENKFTIITCYPENLNSLQKIAVEKLERSQIKFDNDVPEMLSQLCLGSRMLLTNEIEKLSLYLNKDEQLTPQIINEVCDDGSEIFINKVIDLIMSKNCKEAIDALGKFLSSDGSEIAISFLLKRHISLLKKLIEMKTNNENIDPTLKQNGIFFDRVSLVKKQISIWSIKSLNNILYNIEKNEIKLKSSNEIANIFLERLILNICFSK